MDIYRTKWIFHPPRQHLTDYSLFGYVVYFSVGTVYVRWKINNIRKWANSTKMVLERWACWFDGREERKYNGIILWRYLKCLQCKVHFNFERYHLTNYSCVTYGFITICAPAAMQNFHLLSSHSKRATWIRLEYHIRITTSKHQGICTSMWWWASFLQQVCCFFSKIFCISETLWNDC